MSAFRMVRATPVPNGFGMTRYAISLCQKPPAPLRQILSLVRTFGCNLVVEEPVQLGGLDRELQIFQNLSESEATFSITSKRLTFFAVDDDVVPPDNETDHYGFFSQLHQSGKLEGRCLGGAILCSYRHHDHTIRSYVREAVIKTTEEPIKGHFVHARTNFIIPCGPENKFEFPVTGSFFAQQEGYSWCCAHAAIVMLLQHYFAALTGGYSLRLDPLEFNEILNVDYHARPPRKGLKTDEIKAILDHYLGEWQIKSSVLDARDITTNPEEEVLGSAYYAVETGRPAILGFSGSDYGHAMVVVGHTFDPSLWSHDSTAYFRTRYKPYIPSHAWMGNLVVQDDNFGPYRTLPRFILGNRRPRTVVPSFPWSQSSTDRVETFVDRFFRYQNASELTYFQELLRVDKEYLLDKFWFKRLLEMINRDDYVIRTTVILPGQYTDFLKGDYPQPILLESQRWLIDAVKEHLQDQRCWIAEISVPGLYEWHNFRLAEVLLQEPPTKPNKLSVVLARVPGMLSIVNGELEHHRINGDDHYPIITHGNFDFVPFLV